MVVNTPVDSTTYWAPASPHLMLAGSLLKTETKRTETLESVLHFAHVDLYKMTSLSAF